MDLKHLLQRLSFGPLCNLAMSNDGNGTIADNRKRPIVSYINDGLLKLYSKFNLREAELIIEQSNAITFYRLHSRYSLQKAPANPTLPHYIIDSPTRPFTDDLIKVLRVVKEDGLDVPLNDDNRSDSLFTPEIDLLQVADPEDGRPLYVVYQAKHAAISDEYQSAGWEDQPIILPEVLHEALISFVAHKVYFHMNGVENASTASNHLANYNNVCGEVEANDLVSASLSSTSSKFHDRGFC